MSLARFIDNNYLTKEQELEYITKYQNGEIKFLDLLIRKNLNLIHKIANRYSSSHAEKDDLIQESSMGFIHAVKLFDINSGYRLSTYAVNWMGNYCQILVDKNRGLIHAPIYIVKLSRRIYFIREKYGQVTVDFIKSLIPEETIDRIKLAMDLPVTVTSQYVFKDDGEVVDLLDEVAGEPLEDLLHDNYGLLKHYISKLCNRDQQVLNMRLGLRGDDGSSLEDVAMVLNLTRERVRQLQLLALEKIRKIMKHDNIEAVSDIL